MTDLEDTLKERGARYGTFMDNAIIAQDLKQIVHFTTGWKQLDYDQREALDVIISKISRILSGDITYADNWHDIAGYAQLIVKRLEQDISK